MHQNILSNNSLSTNVKSGDIFYENLNTNEHFYGFLLAQQEETKTFIPKRISDHHNFERCIQQFLPAFSLEESDRFNLITRKNSKILLYKLNDWIESLRAIKFSTESTLTVINSIRLEKIEQKVFQFLIEKITSEVEKVNPYKRRPPKNRQLCFK